MNAVIVAVFIMLFLALIRVHIVISLLIGAIIGGLVGGLTLQDTLTAFNEGIKNGASIALSYALLGAFAVAISKSGLPHALTSAAIKQLTTKEAKVRLKWLLILLIFFISIASQNVIPIHVAFIPLLIPPLLYVMAKLNIDRRMIACIMGFGLVTPYMFLPIGFGKIFLHDILLPNIEKGGLDVSHVNVMHAMAIPALSMFIGLLIAIFISYRQPRHYNLGKIENVERTEIHLNRKSIVVSILAIIVAFLIQIYTDSIILGALSGFLLFIASGTIKWREADGAFSEGLRMMAMIGFIMISAQGFAEVLKQTNAIESLVYTSAALFGENKIMASFSMMAVGLVITLGIGSSFSTVPIIAAIYVPLCLHMGFSPLGTVCLIGSAAAIGDAGSPASDSTVASTAGLNVDGQHDHMKDTVVPTFLHYNIPLFFAGWLVPLFL